MMGEEGTTGAAGGLSVADYIEGVEAGWPEDDIGRIVVCGLPRGFVWRSAAEQRAALAERVPLTHTKWDALLAAMVEHLARLYGHEVPAWVDEPARFLDSTWVVSPLPSIRMESLLFAPAAFLRHGAIPDPRDLDGRGGERFEWVPVELGGGPFFALEPAAPADGTVLEALSEELRLREARAQIYLVGGAAMRLAFSRAGRTEDVDVRIDIGERPLTDAVRAVGQRRGLGDAWLNDQVTRAMPRVADRRAAVAYDSPYLTVTGASARHVLAMKLLAAREQDREDIGVLCTHLALTGPEDAIRIYREVFPEEPVKSRAREALALAFPEPVAAGSSSLR